MQKEMVVRLAEILQSKVSSLVLVTHHFTERLLERVPERNLQQVIKEVVLKLRNHTCELIYESAVNNRETRFKTSNRLYVVCKVDVDRKKLVLTTIY